MDEWTQIQKGWLALEAIFSTEDIVVQMPKEANMFKVVRMDQLDQTSFRVLRGMYFLTFRKWTRRGSTRWSWCPPIPTFSPSPKRRDSWNC